MPRVLAVSTRYPDELRRGFGIFVERQLLELSGRNGFEIAVVAPLGVRPFPLSLVGRASKFAGLPERETRRGLTVYRPRFPLVPKLQLGGWTMPPALLRLGRRLHSERRIDVISAEFSWPEAPAAVALGRALGIPVSIKARGLEFELAVSHPLRRPRLLAAMRAAAGLLAVSGEVKQRMIGAGLPGERIRVHYPAVDTEKFAISDRAAAKATLGFAGPVLLTVGNLIGIKQQWLAVEALARLPAATLVIVGGGPKRRSLERRASALGVADRVRFMGQVHNELLPVFYNASDILLHGSSVEGFANVRLEALACGTPVVTTTAGEAGRLIRGPEAGLIVAADPYAMAAAAASIIASPPDRAATRGAIAEFSWARATGELAAYFQDLAALGQAVPVSAD
ncbi:MAG TPA: glycosyltransferase [Allosphingosinicella sp.]|nr:glycosyltransferase [Allosphingosinicella sp.]